MATTGKTALVTGASSGIGLEFCRLLAQDGYSLVLVARSQDKLRKLAAELRDRHGVDSLVVVSDLARSESPEEVFKAVVDAGLTVDVLINNAGYTVFGPFAATDPVAEMDMLKVNMVALTHLTKLFLPGMLERRQGRILNVASTAGFQPGPMMACYYATKAYVVSFSEALGSELAGSGVTVTVLCPGPTETGFALRGKLKGLFYGLPVMKATDVARTGYRALLQGKRMVISGLPNVLMAFSVKLMPRGLVLAALKSYQGARV